MAITQALCASFKAELLEAQHNFNALTGDVFKVALYTSAASLDSSTTSYTTVGEVVGSGYVAGGNVLAGQSVGLSGNSAYVAFTNSAWDNSAITAVGAMVYNSSNANKAVFVLNFGGPYSSTNNTFTVVFPSATSTTSPLIIN
tara:strand:+ start:356 stop:784 length:429 start_codon:yes stop_codon:yes gene_type:complete